MSARNKRKTKMTSLLMNKEEEHGGWERMYKLVILGNNTVHIVFKC